MVEYMYVEGKRSMVEISEWYEENVCKSEGNE